MSTTSAALGAPCCPAQEGSGWTMEGGEESREGQAPPSTAPAEGGHPTLANNVDFRLQWVLSAHRHP